MENYFVIKESTLYQLQLKVNESIKLGYIPSGNMHTTGVGKCIRSGDYYYQPMIRKNII